MKKTSHTTVIKGAIEEFNKYRSPEATAKLISNRERSFKIEFSGPFCRTCGFHDYFDDLLIFLENLGLKAKLGKVKETNSGAVVEFAERA
jgi:hypothetical protein